MSKEDKLKINQQEDIFDNIEYTSIDGNIIEGEGNQISSPSSGDIFVSGFPDENEEVEIPEIQGPEVGDYVLMLHNEVILHGNPEDVLKEVKIILYNQHPDFKDQNITINNLIIFKRIGLKVGVFYE